MPTFELSKMVQASPEKLFSKILDFEYYSNYFPQIKNITIIEKSDTKIVTQETFVFKSIFKKEIVQDTIHNIGNNKLKSEIISGYAKNSTIDVLLTKINTETKVDVKADIHLGLKGKLLQPLIKKFFKMYVNGILMKMLTRIDLDENK
ncbi:MAG: hypothetical protein CL763_07980 [Chloroflexi bacterium]|nr:hypothetical protein [Chloroflexota bacterium]MBL76843.1 hypothetical protein [Chloroflexota bacterium]